MKRNNEEFDDYYDVYEENWTNDTFGELEYTQSLEKNIRKKLNMEELKQKSFFSANDKVKINNDKEQINQNAVSNEEDEKRNCTNLKLNSKDEDNDYMYHNKIKVVNKSSEEEDDRKISNEEFIHKLDESKKTDQESYLFKDIYEELENSRNGKTKNSLCEDGFEKGNDEIFLKKLDYNSSNNETDNEEIYSNTQFNINDSAMHLWDNLNDNNHDSNNKNNDNVNSNNNDNVNNNNLNSNNNNDNVNNNNLNSNNNNDNVNNNVNSNNNNNNNNNKEKEYDSKSNNSFSNYLYNHLDTNEHEKDHNYLNYYKRESSVEKNLNFNEGDIVTIISDNIKEEINLYDKKKSLHNDKDLFNKDYNNKYVDYDNYIVKNKNNSSSNNNSFNNDDNSMNKKIREVSNSKNDDYIFHSSFNSIHNNDHPIKNIDVNFNNNDSTADNSNGNSNSSVNNNDYNSNNENSVNSNYDNDGDGYDSNIDNSIIKNNYYNNKENKKDSKIKENDHIYFPNNDYNLSLYDKDLNNSIDNLNDCENNRNKEDKLDNGNDEKLFKDSTYVEQKSTNFKMKKSNIRKDFYSKNNANFSSNDNLIKINKNKNTINNKTIKNFVFLNKNNNVYSEGKDNKENVLRNNTRKFSYSFQKKKKNEHKEVINNSNDGTDIICVDLNDEEQWEEIDSENIKKNNLKKKKKVVVLKEKMEASKKSITKDKNNKISLKKKDTIYSKEKTKFPQKTNKSNTHDELKELGEELNKQISNLEKEQNKVKKLEYELIAKSAEMELEREEMKNKIEEERKRMVKTIEEEKKKWSKEKKRIEHEVEKQRSIILNRRKLTNEIAMFKNKIKELEENIKKERKQHKAIIDKLKKGAESLTKENEKLKMDLKISEEYRKKLENYQEKTIMKLAKNVNERKKKKKSYEYTEEESNYNSISDNPIESKEDTRGYKLHTKKKKDRKDETENESAYMYERKDCRGSDSSENSEIKNIINGKYKKIQNELDIIYDTSNSGNENSKDIFRKDDPYINLLNSKLKKKKKITLNNLFVHKEDTKNSDSFKTNEEYINKNLKKVKSLIEKNKNKLNSDKLTIEEDKSSISTSKNNKNLKEFFFENNNRTNDNFMNKDIIYEEKDINDEKENFKNSSFLNNYPYSKNEKIKITKSYDRMFENLNEKVSANNLITNNNTQITQHIYENQKYSLTNKNENVVGNFLTHNTKQDINSYMATSKQIEKKNYEYSKKTSKSVKNNLSDDTRNYSNNHSTDNKYLNDYDVYNNYSHEDCNNNMILRNNLSQENFMKKGSEDNNYYNMNPFGKNWNFIINFNFDELFNGCEEVIKSVFSSSKKIKYRQAFIDGKVETLFDDGLKIIEKNKNKKIIHPNNLIIYLYPSRDYKAKLPNSYMLCHFVSKSIYQVNIPNKCQLNKFPSGQVDCKYNDGHIQILFVDGRRKEILPNREEYAILRNGTIKKLN